MHRRPNANELRRHDTRHSACFAPSPAGRRRLEDRQNNVFRTQGISAFKTSSAYNRHSPSGDRVRRRDSRRPSAGPGGTAGRAARPADARHRDSRSGADGPAVQLRPVFAVGDDAGRSDFRSHGHRRPRDGSARPHRRARQHVDPDAVSDRRHRRDRSVRQRHPAVHARRIGVGPRGRADRADAGRRQRTGARDYADTAPPRRRRGRAASKASSRRLAFRPAAA